MKTIFEIVAEKDIKCEVCGEPTIALYGGGWDNDRIYCSDSECGAEYVFPTSTNVLEEGIDEQANTV